MQTHLSPEAVGAPSASDLFHPSRYRDDTDPSTQVLSG